MSVLTFKITGCSNVDDKNMNNPRSAKDNKVF